MSYVTTPELIVSDMEDNCLEFYYHLDGIDSGAFVIIANALDTPFAEIPQEGNIPAQRGGQVIVIYQTRTVTSEWKRTLITFSPKRLGQKNGDRVNFSLIYRDVRGPKGDFGKFSFHSYFFVSNVCFQTTKMKTKKAIDNFRLHSNSCNNICPDGDREFTCDATQPRSDRNCIDPNKKCDRRNDCDNAKDELDCIFMADIQIRDPLTVHRNPWINFIRFSPSNTRPVSPGL